MRVLLCRTTIICLSQQKRLGRCKEREQMDSSDIQSANLCLSYIPSSKLPLQHDMLTPPQGESMLADGMSNGSAVQHGPTWELSKTRFANLQINIKKRQQI